MKAVWRCAILSAALEASALAAGAQAPSDIAEARRLINAGEPATALVKLRTLKGEGDRNREMQLALLTGVAHYHAGDVTKAIEALAPVVDRFAADSIERREAEQVLGLSLFLAGRFAEALPRLQSTRRWAGENSELALALGQTYVHTQQPDAAREVFAALFRLPADSAAAHLIAAQMMIRLEQEPQAEKELGRALDKDPRLPVANMLLGQIALFRGRFAEAVTFTERELAINPANAAAFSQLGDAFGRQGKWDEAIAVLQKSVWLNPYYSAPYILLGRAYTRKDQHAAAEGMFRRAIEYDPNNRTAHYLLAQLLQQLGRAEEAKREFEIAERLRGARGA